MINLRMVGGRSTEADGVRSRGVKVLAVVLAMVLVTGLAAGWALRRRRDRDTPERVAARYFEAWSKGDLDAMRAESALR